MSPDRVSAWTVELPLRHAFRSAGSSLQARTLVLIKLEVDDFAGWGEAAAVPGHTTETSQDVWGAVPDAAANLLAAASPQASGLLGAAIAQARVDLEAKVAAQPLWQLLGGDETVWASAAVGLDESGQPDLASLEEAATQGYRYAKLKITEQTTSKSLQRARNLFPEMEMGLDANESLATAHPSQLMAVDALGFAYLEQPGAASDLGWHTQLCRQMITPIALDESAHSAAAVAQILKNEAANIINLKAGRFGTRETLNLARIVANAGMAARVGGFVESGIGRAHSVALATCSDFSVTGDIAGSNRYFDNDLVDPQWRLAGGRLPTTNRPGIGVSVDEEAVARYSLDSFFAE